MPINPPFRQADLPIITQSIAPNMLPPNMPPPNMMPPNFVIPRQFNQGVGVNGMYLKQTSSPPINN
jgi:hypothetical protein